VQYNFCLWTPASDISLLPASLLQILGRNRFWLQRHSCTGVYICLIQPHRSKEQLPRNASEAGAALSTLQAQQWMEQTTEKKNMNRRTSVC